MPIDDDGASRKHSLLTRRQVARWTHYMGTMPPQGLQERYKENWCHGTMLPGKNNSDLSESDKQLISNLETIGSGGRRQ